MSEIVVEREIEGKKYSFRTGKLARQAGGAVFVELGGVEVLATAVMNKQVSGNDFFPLTVHYNEKYYAYGRIPGGYTKREGKLSDAEVLVSRMIDRPLRPLFPEGFFNEVQVISTVLGMDGVNPADVVGINGASASLAISDIPFGGPVGAVRVGCVGGRFVANPTYDEMKESTMDLIVAGTQKAITMIEGDCLEFSEEKVLEAVDFAHRVIKEVVALQLELKEKAGKEKIKVELFSHDKKLVSDLKKDYYERLRGVLRSGDKVKREEETAELFEKAEDEYEDVVEEESFKHIGEILRNFEKEIVREDILTRGIRSDGRAMDELRPISCEVDILKNAHGSALFTRGQTQSLGVVTMAPLGDSLDTNNALEDERKRFFLQYNFPPFSVGEVGRLGAPGRREIGHGMLAERSLQRMFPSEEQFPFALRLVSEILESNGSSSMATICSGSMALMAAGVPVKKMVAGIAMGLIMEGDKYQILTDIQGLEDHLGDMDFKVAGTSEGITGFQLDIKIEGITLEIMSEALKQAKKARLEILEKMKGAIDKPRSTFSKTAPIVKEIEIPSEKIKLVIGPSGKNIKRIVEKTKSQVEVSDNGKVKIYARSLQSLEETIKMIDGFTGTVIVGTVYEGRVKKVTAFGAFVEVLPGIDGLLHVSEMKEGRLERVEDFLKEGQTIRVKIIGVDDRGKISLSHKQLKQDGQ